MASKLAPVWQDKYIGDMTEQQAKLIMEIRDSDNIKGLERMIFNFPPDMVAEALDRDISVLQLVREKGLNAEDYLGKLKSYQTTGTAFMYASPRSMIADGCGLGKTAEIAGLINLLRAKGEINRFLMAVENAAVGQTVAELMKFTGLKVVAIPPEAANLRKCMAGINWAEIGGIVIKHSTLRSDAFSQTLALNLNEHGKCKLFDTFILDESSVIKNQNSKIYKYTLNICNIVDRVHMMNATAFETNIMDIYYQLDMINEKLLPTKSVINREYCTFTRGTYWTKQGGKAKMNWKWDLTGYKNQEDFKKKLQLVYFGRSKQDIGIDAPHVYKVYEIEPSGNQSLAINKGYRYNEVLNCPSLIPELKIPTDRKKVPKLEKLLSLIENEFTDSQVMVYAFHIDSQKAIKHELEKIGRKPVILNGSLTDSEKYEVQSKFNSGEYDVIITNIKKSLNLNGADVCIFYSVLTNPATMFQTASRIDRNTDDRIKTFILLLYYGTDEYRFFTDVVKSRAKDARDLTIDSKTTVDYFIDAMMNASEE